ncbi:MAG: DUF4860 domain-containing protein [Anaerotignum sp.]|nr:DUF4860 domain-containing protein [Anaerotignum sp.]
MKNEQKQLKMGSLLALMVFGVFAACLLFLLLTGADVYQKMRERDTATYESRTAVQYMTTRVRQADRAESITAEMFDGLDALVLLEEIEGETYKTKLYCYDGWLTELYAAACSDLSPADGEKILELKGLELSLQDGFLQAKLTLPDGREEELSLQLRSGREAVS